MANEKILVSAAMLAAIKNDSNKNSKDLLKPFILDIIGKKYKLKDVVDTNYIQNTLINTYYFEKIPLAIIIKVLNDLASSKIKILEKKDNNYYLVKDIKDTLKEFNNQFNNSKKIISNILNELVSYLNQDKYQLNVNVDKAEQYFLIFIDSYGFNMCRNIDIYNEIDINKEKINYYIGKFIYECYDKKSPLFDDIQMIIEGHMLADIIYLQLGEKNNYSLENIKFYFDTSILLRILGLKTEEENTTALELKKLLLKYKATICCFKHNFDEVYNIINNYKNNRHKNRASTLEYFDVHNTSDAEIEQMLNTLAVIFKSNNIIIDDKPSFDDSNKQYMLDYSGMTNKLIEYKESHNSYYSEDSIINDVNSICSINILRKGKKFHVIEECKYFFVTSFYYLALLADKEVNLKETEVSLAMNDLNLTSILWFKDLESNSELPKMRLIEMALAATSPDESFMKRTIEVFERIKESHQIKDVAMLSQIISKDFVVKSGLFDSTNSDEEIITEEYLGNYLTSIIDENKKLNRELENTKENNIGFINELIKNDSNEVNIKYDKKVRFLKGFIICILILLDLIIVTFEIIDFINKNQFTFISISLFLVGIVGNIVFINFRTEIFRFFVKFIEINRDKEISKIYNKYNKK